MFRTGNPALNKNTFAKSTAMPNETGYMTIDGAVNKTFYLFVILLIPAVYVWYLFATGSELVIPLMLVGIVGSLVCAIVMIFKKEWAKNLAILYAALEGLAVGGISAFFEAMYSGIVIQAVALTLGVMVMMLFLYKTKIIKVTENFKMGLLAATGAIFLIYLISFILSFFGISVPYIHESGLIGIGFSLFVVTIAALNLVLDFDFIEKGAESRAAKHLEWYAAFGLLVTLVWLYIEILRLLAKLKDRR